MSDEEKSSSDRSGSGSEGSRGSEGSEENDESDEESDAGMPGCDPKKEEPSISEVM